MRSLGVWLGFTLLCACEPAPLAPVGNEICLPSWWPDELAADTDPGQRGTVPGTRYGLETSATFVASADINRDGRIDLVAAGMGDRVAILFGRGDGTFESPLHFPTRGTTGGLAIGDVNEDGAPDLITANETRESTSVLLNNGNGTFQAPIDHPAAKTPHTIASGDIDRDGHLDLAITNQASGHLTLLFGRGDGTFQAGWLYVMGVSNAVVLADLDHDGWLDVAYSDAQFAVWVIKGGSSAAWVTSKGTTSTFPPTTAYPLGVYPDFPQPLSMCSADFDGDGELDLAVGNSSGRSVSFLFGAGGGTFAPAEKIELGTYANAVSCLDLGRDGRLDVVVSSYMTAGATLLLGEGNRRFRKVLLDLAGANAAAVASGDFNADGRTDLAIGMSGGTTIEVRMPTTCPRTE